jgi:hypothetical protein
MSGFSFRQQIDGTNSYALLEIAATASVVYQKGDLIRVNADGTASLVTTGDLVLGVVEGVVDANGLPIDRDSGTTDTWTMASTTSNKVQYIPALQQYLFYADSDGSLTATMMFQFFGVDDENNPDTASTAPSDSTVNTLRLIKRDPDGDGDASKGLWQIVESFWAQNAMGTVATDGIEAA